MRSCSFSEAGLVWTAVRAGLAGAAADGTATWKRLNSPQPASKSGPPSSMGNTHGPRPSPVIRRPAFVATAATLPPPAVLPSAEQFDLPHLEHLNSGTVSRLDEAPNTNTLVFQRLGLNTRRPKTGKRSPWNSHSEVPCPASSEIQICGSPRLPDGQYLALDQRKSPDRSQNSARTFRVFYGRRVGPDASFCIARLGLGCQQRGGAILVGRAGRHQRLSLPEQFGLHQR